MDSIDLGKYIGIPFKDLGRDENGCDCWGLVRLIYKNELKIDLPDMGPLYRDTHDILGMIDVYSAQLPKWVKVDTPKFWDIVLLKILDVPIHVGVVIGDCRMIHIERGMDSINERFDGLLWKNRIAGFYRLRSTNF